jgi:hypothetical protein
MRYGVASYEIEYVAPTELEFFGRLVLQICRTYGAKEAVSACHCIHGFAS